MKHFIKRITALTLAVLTLGAATSCGKEKPEEINDSQESSVSSEESAENKKKIILAVLESDSSLYDIVRRHNAYNETYEIELINYSLKTQQSEEGYFSEAFNSLKMDLISGKQIDMVILSAEDMYPLVNNGYLADLYKVMDSTGEYKKEDFLPNVLEGLEYEGELPVICDSFIIHTAVAKSSNISEQSADWTLEEAMDYYEGLPDDTDLLYKIWESDDLWRGNTLDNYIMRKIVRDSTDLQSRECNFGTAFINAVEFLKGKDFAASNLSHDVNQDISEEQWSLINDKAILNCTTITGFNAYLSQEVSAVFGGEDITYVGFPSENGSGAVTDAGRMYGIIGNSDYKEEAWDFIEKRLSSPTSIPVLTKLLEESAAEEDTTGNRSLKKPQQLPFPEQDTEITISDETIQKTLDYIKNIEFTPYYSTEVESIICEEYEAVLAGEKSAEEVAEILQSRVEIYLSERS